jgi:hypothetical protein
MNRTSINNLKVSTIVIFTFFTVMISSGSAPAGDLTMQTNLNDIADQMSRWSKHCSTSKMTPEAQEKLGELLFLTSQLLKDMAEKSGGKMNTEHSNKIQAMKKDWDPFDTSSGM